MRRAEEFFAYARERQEIHLRRSRGQSRPWTKDKILGHYRFCCVFREDDRTTRWFREHVRDHLRRKLEVVLATVVFRMFNRIDSGEAIFSQLDIEGGTPFDLFLRDGNVKHLRKALIAHLGSGPYVTGSYIISSPPGYTKLDGVLEILRRFNNNSGWNSVAEMMSRSREKNTLEGAWEWLREQDYLGKFHSYEIVTDLRHTALLDHAPDIMTWANPGPGARRGLCRVMGKSIEDRIGRDAQIDLMRQLLMSSRGSRMWPSEWPQWEMREVEHTLCEFDKYERARLGQGRPRGVLR